MKTKIKIFSVAFGSCLLITAYANAQASDLQWVKQTAGNSNDFGSVAATDHSGNVYMTGQFAGMADFDPGPGIFPLTAVEGASAFICKLDSSGNLIWAKKFDGAAGGKSICIDDSGHIYTTGFLYGTVDFDPGPGIHNLTAQYNDPFICKWDTAGNFIWANSLVTGGNVGYSIKVDMQENVYVTGYAAFICKLDKWGNLLWTANFTNNFPYCKSITVDASGNILTTGEFSGPTDFDPGPGTFNLDALGQDDIFISKLNSNGNFAWAKRIGGKSSIEDIGYSITTDASGNIYATGQFADTVDFDPGPGSFNLISNYSKSSFILKLDSSANFIWAKSMNGIGSSTSIGRSIILDPSGNIITTGNFSGTVDFDPGSGTNNLTSSQYATVFVNKLDSLGNFVWAGHIGGTSYGFDGPSVVSDDFGNILASGFFQKTADFDPGPGIYNLSAEGDRNIFITKLNASGNFAWGKSVVGSNVNIRKSDVDAAGNVYTTGGFEGTADFDPDSGNTFLNYSGNQDAYVRKVNFSGNLIWAKSFGGTSVEYGKTVAVDNSGNVYLSGYFSGTADFDPGPGVYNLTATGIGGSIYISKLDANGNFLWAEMLAEKYYANNFFGDMDVDASGNIYLTGTLEDTIDFDPGPGIYNLVPGTDPFGDFYEDSYVLKLDASGNFQWAYVIGQPDDRDNGSFITVDATGNVYLSGSFGIYADFDPGPGIYNISTTCPPLVTCIIKLTAAGNFVWAKTFECYGAGYAEPGALFARSNGSLIISGDFGGTIDFDPGPGIDTLTAASQGLSPDMYIVKINSAGNFVWDKKIETGSTFGSLCSSISCDNPGNVYVSGIVSGNFNPAIFCKLNAGGNLLWNNSISAGYFFDHSSIPSVGLDQHDNLYLTGVFASDYDFDLTAGVNNITASGTYDVFIAKYGSSNPVCSTAPTSIFSNATANTICAGQQVTLTKYGGTLSQSGDFYWYADSCGGTPLGTGQSLNFFPSDTTTYYVRAEDSCGVTSCVSIKIKVKAPVAPPTITGNGLFCPGNSIVLDAGSGYAGYQWSTGSTAQTTVVNSGGLYTVTISSVNGCTAATSITVTIFPSPPAVITPSSNVDICLGDTVHFTVNAGAGYIYQWRKNSLPLAGATNSFYNAITNGYFSCSITDSNFCESISDAVKVTIVCVPPDDPELRAANDLPGEIAVVPNPAVDFIVVSSGNSGSSREFDSLKQTEITVKDVLGNLVLKIPNAVFPAKINVGGFSKGIYFISLQTEKEFLTTKFSKQ